MGWQLKIYRLSVQGLGADSSNDWVDDDNVNELMA